MNERRGSKSGLDAGSLRLAESIHDSKTPGTSIHHDKSEILWEDINLVLPTSSLPPQHHPLSFSYTVTRHRPALIRLRQFATAPLATQQSETQPPIHIFKLQSHTSTFQPHIHCSQKLDLLPSLAVFCFWPNLVATASSKLSIASK